jgi:hypothetical protein
MGTVGIFAGRGDVIIALILAMIIGGYIGHKLTRSIQWLSTKFKKEN